MEASFAWWFACEFFSRRSHQQFTMAKKSALHWNRGMRDAVFTISDKIECSMGGPPLPLEYTPDSLQTVGRQEKTHPAVRGAAVST